MKKIFRLETDRYTVSPCNNRFLGKCWAIGYSIKNSKPTDGGFTGNVAYILIKSLCNPLSIAESNAPLFSKIFEGKGLIPLRITSACLPGFLGDMECDCAEQNDKYLKEIYGHGNGVFILLPQESKGRGLRNKLKDHRLQLGINEKGVKVTPLTLRQSFKHLYPKEKYDKRQYFIVREILEDLGLEKVKYLYLGKDSLRFNIIKRQTKLNLVKNNKKK